MITTDGTASPKAQGHDATRIDIALSKGKHQTQYSSISTISNPIKNVQIKKTIKPTKITPSTNL